MQERFKNTDRFNRLVDDLKSDFSVGENPPISDAEHITGDAKYTRALEAKILAATAQLSQYASLESEHSMPIASWRQWRSRFALPLVASIALGAAIFMLTPSATLPSKLTLVASNETLRDQRVSEEVYLGGIAFGDMDVALAEADITFQELWLTEDEWLFLEEI